MSNQAKVDSVVKAFLAKVEEIGADIVVCHDNLYAYDEGCWSLLQGSVKAKFDRLMEPCCSDFGFPYAKDKDIWHTLETKFREVPRGTFNSSSHIVCTNGTLDLRTFEFGDHDPNNLTTRRLGIEFDDEAQCPEWEAGLRRMFDNKPEEEAASIIEFLQCWFGLAIAGFKDASGRDFRKMLFLYGPPYTGKSSIAETLKTMFREEEVCTMAIADMNGTFGLAPILTAKAIISDDGVGTEKSAKLNSLAMKRLITGNAISINQKYRNIVDNFTYFGPILVTGNTKPTIKDTSAGMYARIVMITTDRVFTEAEGKALGGRKFDEYIRDIGELPGVLNWAIKGYFKVLKLGRLPTVVGNAANLEELRAENDPVYAFLSEHCEGDDKVYTSVGAVAAAMSIYSEVEMGTRDYPPTRCKQLLWAELAGIIPGAKKGMKWLGQSSARVVTGLRVKESGKRYLTLAEDRGLLTPKTYKVNGDLL